MDFLNSALKKSTGGNEAEKKEQGQAQHHQQSGGSANCDLMSSAKQVAEAAQSTFSGHSDQVDKGKAAGAAADLLDGASKYGKLEEGKGVGKYVDKAEDYLRNYETTHSTTTTTPAAAHGHSESAPQTAHTTPSAPAHGGSDGDSAAGNKYGEYFKAAEGFLKKN